MAVTLPPDAMAELFDARIDAPDNAPPSWNVCPTHDIRVAVSGEDGRMLRKMRWGFIPRWYKTPSDGPLLINARSETVAEKPAFRDAVRNRRCLVPASGFYEWTRASDGGKDPWYIHPAEGEAFAFAGVWRDWQGPDGPIHGVAVLTCPASAELSHIHDRMPVIIAREDFGLWLGEKGKGAALLMRPAPQGTCAAHRVSRAVNSNKPNDASLLEPV